MSRQGNILLVANWGSDVGYAWWLMENFWVAISEHFTKHGVNCHLIYPNISTIPATIAASGITTTELDFKNHSLQNLKVLHRLIKDTNIKYIYLTDSPSRSLFYILLRLWGIKIIVVHDHTPGDRTLPSGAKSYFKSAIQKTPFITADHFIAVSDFVYKRLINVSRIAATKCSCAANGINPINLSGHDHEYAYNTFGIPANRKIIITTGRASYYKGIDFFIRCANELVNNRKITHLHFLYCGDGPDLDDFKAMASKYKLDQHFTFPGKRPDVRKILPSCEIGFHTSKGEVGYSLSILEYMSAGLATIVPDLPSTSEATSNRETGLLYTHGDITSACDAISQCLSGKLKTKLSTNAIAAINERYNIKNTNNQLTDILNTVFT